MSLTPTFSDISVEQFFSNANWRGIKRNQPSSVITTQELINADDFIPNLNLRVEEFFTHHNWKGIKKMVAYTSHLNTNNDDLSTITNLSLQMKVGDFFQRFPWAGEQIQETKTSIAQKPIIEKRQNIPTSTFSELKMNDLSDLF